MYTFLEPLRWLRFTNAWIEAHLLLGGKTKERYDSAA